MTQARSVHCDQHARHVGVCPACQRARLAAEKQQLIEAHAVREMAEGRGVEPVRSLRAAAVAVAGR